ncbi:hypothetical protein PH213_20665 [Streptomyces sp. SRF1]|uniref:hypothetical protein n=1 Tax=Streptomyces sp. SRF1 TaxID=1549642 RepID=UPI0025AFC46B|nr:hypothetical protein [Streptomyces sp. SRF1]MDN3056920.1 hypothetical protein [Streptomyces sp. SRF1]
MTPMTDAERVLGQIKRGEVIAGPEGARRIAARHEAAYGVVWRRRAPAAPAAPPTPDAAWADAVQSLTRTETTGDLAA